MAERLSLFHIHIYIYGLFYWCFFALPCKLPSYGDYLTVWEVRPLERNPDSGQKTGEKGPCELESVLDKKTPWFCPWTDTYPDLICEHHTHTHTRATEPQPRPRELTHHVRHHHAPGQPLSGICTGQTHLWKQSWHGNHRPQKAGRDFLSVVVQSLRCVWLCNPMDCSMPGFPVLHHLPKFTQIHVHWVCDAI